MIVHERKCKYKHKVTVSPDENGTYKHQREMRAWCESTFGPSGRRERWRFGWLGANGIFYFKEGKDAIMFTLRWAA